MNFEGLLNNILNLLIKFITDSAGAFLTDLLCGFTGSCTSSK